MGESEGQRRKGECRHYAEEANDVCQRPQADCCGATCPVGESENCKEIGLTDKQPRVPGLTGMSLGISIIPLRSLRSMSEMAWLQQLGYRTIRFGPSNPLYCAGSPTWSNPFSRRMRQTGSRSTAPRDKPVRVFSRSCRAILLSGVPTHT